MDATAQAGLVRSGQVTPAELLDAAIERITELDPGVNAVVMRWFDTGQPLSDGNRRLKEAAVPSHADATVVARFRAAGLVTAGRTNSAEFGSLPATEPLAWGPTRNP
jgi:amidase